MMQLRDLSAKACLILLLLCPLANAQEKLPLELISVNAALEASQQRSLDAYTRFWVEQLINSSDEQILVARSNLTNPFTNPSATKIFKTAYSTILARTLTETLKSDRMLVRLNAMLCCAYLTDSTGINLVGAGLADKNPAIRYLAGKAAGTIGRQLKPEDQQRILNLLNMSFARETDQVVVEQLLGGLSALTIPQARRDILEGLNKRVNVHHANTNITLKADRQGMIHLFRQLVREHASDKPVSKQMAKRFARVVCRFLVHCTAALDDGRVHRSMTPQYTSLIIDCDSILRWLASRPMQIAESDLPLKDIEPNLQAQRWTEARLRAEDWRKTLQDQPFNLSARRLAVP